MATLPARGFCEPLRPPACTVCYNRRPIRGLAVEILSFKPPVKKIRWVTPSTQPSYHRFFQGTEFDFTDGHVVDTEVAIVFPAVPGVADTDRSPFVNINSTTVVGIQRAKGIGFSGAQLAHVVVSPFMFELNDLFT